MAAHQIRSSAHPKKPLPAHARPSKPAPLSKRVNSHGTNKGGHKAAQNTEEDLVDEESMATSFLQYWYAKNIIIRCQWRILTFLQHELRETNYRAEQFSALLLGKVCRIMPL